jgi:hypothetical protein
MQPMKNFLLLLVVCIWIVSVINLRVSIYSVVLQYFIYYVIIMITYLLKCVLVAPIMYVLLLVSLFDLNALMVL